MAVRQPNGTVHNTRSKTNGSHLEFAEDSDSTSSNSPDNINQTAHNMLLKDDEPEHHTEASSPSSTPSSDFEQTSDVDIITAHPTETTTHHNPPFLPTELLQGLPSPATYALGDAASVTWNEMTRAQKRRERLRSRKVKAREWEWRQPGSVLRARRKAMERRARARVEIGEESQVGRNRRVEVSGRQKLVEARRRLAEQARGALMKAPKRGKSKG